MLGGFCYLLYFCKKINDMEETKHIKISDYNYPLPDERIAKFPLPVRDQSKLLVYQHGQISETHFTSLPDYLEPGTLMIFNNTKVIQARLHFRKETGALIEIFCLEPIEPNDYVLNFQQTQHAAWLCMIGNLKKWKEGPLHKEMTVKGKTLTLTATRGECHGTSHWIDFTWDNPEVTFADILEFFGELPIPPYLNRETQESDKETYQTVYSKIKGSVAAPTAGLHFTERVLNALKEKGVDLEEVTLHVGAGTFKPVKSEEIEGHEMHTEYISVNRGTIEKLLAHGGEAVAVGTTSVRTLESLYYIGVTLSQHPDARTARTAMATLRNSSGVKYHRSPATDSRLHGPEPARCAAHQYTDYHCTGIQLPHRQENGHQLPPAAKHPAVTGLCFCERKLASHLRLRAGA